MVATGHYLATVAGFQILEAGGNAVDAGCAAGITLAVVQSDIVNLAGVAPMMIYDAARRTVVTVDGLGTWPRAIEPELFRRDFGGAIPPGILRTVVPAAPDAWITALERFGTMSFGEVAAAGIRFARDGFPMYTMMSDWLKRYAASYRRWPSSAAHYLPGGAPPEPGQLFTQRDLARTLQYLVDEEKAHSGQGRIAGLQAARDAFYRGDIARVIVRFHGENDGRLTEEDLAGFRVRLEQPAVGSFRGLEIYTCGPWCQGPVLLQMLNLLEDLPLAEFGHNSPSYIHSVVEAMKLAFADRHSYYGDPRHVPVPLDGLLSKVYAQHRRTLIRDTAWPEMPPPGDPQTLAPIAPRVATMPADGPLSGTALDDAVGDTSYVCVIDANGNAFSCTPSDDSRDTPIIPGTGLAPSSRGSQSWTDPAHPAVIAPGKRPRLTPNPAMVFRNGQLWMPLGSPGGDSQAQAMLQVLLNLVVFDMEPQAAVEAPRFCTFSHPDSREPHEYLPGQVSLESRIKRDTEDALTIVGHRVHWWPDLSVRAGGVCLIKVDESTGILCGAADPRRTSYAVGW